MTKIHTRIIWIVISKNMCITKTITKIIWIVIRTKMCMTKPIRTWIVIRTKVRIKKTNTKIIWISIRTKMFMLKTPKNMDSHSCRDVHDENTYKNNINCLLYEDEHDENP